MPPKRKRDNNLNVKLYEKKPKTNDDMLNIFKDLRILMERMEDVILVACIFERKCQVPDGWYMRNMRTNEMIRSHVIDGVQRFVISRNLNDYCYRVNVGCKYMDIEIKRFFLFSSKGEMREFDKVIAIERCDRIGFRLVFLKSGEDVYLEPPSECKIIFKNVVTTRHNIFNGVPCFLLGKDLFEYMIYVKDVRIF